MAQSEDERRESKRRSNQTYQTSPKGRAANARGQAKYRERLRTETPEEAEARRLESRLARDAQEMAVLAAADPEPRPASEPVAMTKEEYDAAMAEYDRDQELFGPKSWPMSRNA